MDIINFEDWDWEEYNPIDELKEEIKKCISEKCVYQLPTISKEIIGDVCERYKDDNIINNYSVSFPDIDNGNFNVIDIYLNPVKQETLVLNTPIKYGF